MVDRKRQEYERTKVEAEIVAYRNFTTEHEEILRSHDKRDLLELYHRVKNKLLADKTCGDNERRILQNFQETFGLMEAAVVPKPPIKNSKPIKPGIGTAAWVCFVLGIGFMFISLATFFIYVPLILVSIILSIVMLAQGRIVKGILILLINLIVPGVWFFGLTAYRVGTALNKADQQKVTALSAVELEELEGYIDGNYMYCKGKVRNNGVNPVSFVKVGVEWLDENGNILDTDETFAIGSEELRPGGAKSFSIMTPKDTRMKNYRTRVIK